MTFQVSCAVRVVVVVLVVVGLRAGAAEVTPLELRVEVARGHDVQVKAADGGAVEVRTTGRDPYLFLKPAKEGEALELAGRHVLEFEYFSAGGVRPFRVRVDPTPAHEHFVAAEDLGISEGWSRRSIDLSPLLGEAAAKARAVRLDLGQRAGRVVSLRAVRLRAMDENERRVVAEREARRAREREAEGALRAYLDRKWPAELTRVDAHGGMVHVTGRVPAGKGRAGPGGEEGEFALARLPLHAEVTDAASLEVVAPVRARADGTFEVAPDRYTYTPKGRGPDRLTDRWAVVEKVADGGLRLASHLRYAELRVGAGPPRPVPRNRKGLGALWVDRPVSDLDELGVSFVTVNVVLQSFMRAEAGPGRTAFEAMGRTWYADDAAVATLDQVLREAAKRAITVSAILLVSPAGRSADAYGKLVAHPDADAEGIYVMPNLTSAEGVAAYGAALEFLARRYSRPDGKFGRIHHWILHNEVDAGWVWTNAGEKSLLRYVELYHKSMRLAHLIARKYDAGAKAFVSLTHYWAKPGERRFYAGRDVLDRLLEYSRAEGDFDWALAHHPYAQDLGNPRTWEDQLSTYSLDTPQVTFKNLEVLGAWARQPRAMYLGKQLRTIHLTEQGLNSRDYSEKSLREQAAGMAYAWHKLAGVPEIEAFQYHNWVDNRGEGGLRIGLRRFPDDKEEPLGKKPVWKVFKALDTPGQAAATEAYKEVVGVKDWAEVRYGGEIK
jgi:hypothetical protein